MIEVKNLTKKFGEFTAVNDLSFGIRPGETFALLGPNGSGKTTTLKCMVGLTVPTAGEILVGGLDVWKKARESRSLMSYLPQHVSFHDNLTAREVMQFYCRLRKLPATRIDKVLGTSQFGFNGFTDKPVGEYSGGMVQRLGIAVACLPDAPILLLDEPTASLDPARAIEFREYLQSLRRAGKTIVFTSHVLADVEQLADRVAILVGGKLAAIESISALRESLMHSCRMRVVMANPEPRWAEAARQAGAIEAALDGDSLLVTSRAEDRLGILRAIEAAGGRVARFATEELSLENIYLRYINEGQATDSH
ncbi:MAG TPA: ABC transporter ATP-binding protein [Blastocatellia bacterium]|nr:ABC transporter ATP-binding protein [Blastocatellia bacterium]